MKLISLCASLLLAGALLFIFSSATTKPTVDNHKPVATFWPGAKVRNNTDWIMNVEIIYVGYNAPKKATIEPHTTHTFENSTNLIQSVSAYLDANTYIKQFGDTNIGKRRMFSEDATLAGMGCGIKCNFTITQQLYDININSDSTYKPTITKD